MRVYALAIASVLVSVSARGQVCGNQCSIDLAEQLSTQMAPAGVPALVADAQSKCPDPPLVVSQLSLVATATNSAESPSSTAVDSVRSATALLSASNPAVTSAGDAANEGAMTVISANTIRGSGTTLQTSLQGPRDLMDRCRSESGNALNFMSTAKKDFLTGYTLGNPAASSDSRCVAAMTALQGALDASLSSVTDLNSKCIAELANIDVYLAGAAATADAGTRMGAGEVLEQPPEDPIIGSQFGDTLGIGEGQLPSLGFDLGTLLPAQPEFSGSGLIREAPLMPHVTRGPGPVSGRGLASIAWDNPFSVSLVETGEPLTLFERAQRRAQGLASSRIRDMARAEVARKAELKKVNAGVSAKKLAQSTHSSK